MTDLSLAAELAWRIAALEARRGRARAIGPGHLLVGLLSLEKLLEPAAGLQPDQRTAVQQEHEALTRVLERAGLDAATLRREIRDGVPAGERAELNPHRDAACRAVFERGEALARERGDVPCSVLHLLAAAIERERHVFPSQMQQEGTGSSSGLERLRAQVERAAASPQPHEKTQTVPPPAIGLDVSPPSIPGRAPPVPDAAPSLPPESGRDAPTATPPSPSPVATATVPAVLLRHGRDLTAEAMAGRLPPVIGRHDEMLQVVRVLHRRTKNSPVLLGDAGVGKTAIVEGLARRIAEGTSLPGRRIVALSLASVVAGTTFRGQFEERLEEILAALRGRPDLILFLDELHTIVGAGDSDGRLDAANILKPALARGEIACIGATTTDEYRKYIEGDAALERRFQPVLVAEPMPAEARMILDGLRADLEQHHDVTVEPDALDAAVELTVRYVPTRRLPDKAVDALDEACARASVPTLTHRPGLSTSTQRVTRETVAEVVSEWTGIPLGRIGRAEADTLTDLEVRLAEQIVGQDAAISQVAQRVRLARIGLTDPSRPAGVFLLLGPSGVGKTALTLALAESIGAGTAGQPHLIRLDMSEYAEKHQAARLIGAPPGYVGHAEEGQLTGPLRRHPHAVVLLDEVEKAHPEVFDLFLQVFDAGRITDAHGRLVDGRQAIFVLTSNLVPSGAGRRQIGFRREPTEAPEAQGRPDHPSTDREALLAELRAFFRPELLNRIDEIVLLRSLDEAATIEIARRRLAALRVRLREQHEIDLTVSDEALAFIGRQAAAGSGAAREIQRIVARSVEEPLSRELLAGRIVRREHLIVQVRAGALETVRDTQTM